MLHYFLYQTIEYFITLTVEFRVVIYTREKCRASLVATLLRERKTYCIFARIHRTKLFGATLNFMSE